MPRDNTPKMTYGPAYENNPKKREWTPLQRKTRKSKPRKVLFDPQSYAPTPGVQHTIEGMGKVYKSPKFMRAFGLDTRDKARAATQKMTARSRIKPIADPEAGQSERRRRAARRRMKGRLGTMLSERETLG